jgi:hypothetical protein
MATANEINSIDGPSRQQSLMKRVSLLIRH